MTRAGCGKSLYGSLASPLLTHDTGRDVLAELINCADHNPDTPSVTPVGDPAPSHQEATISPEAYISASTSAKSNMTGYASPEELRPPPNWNGMKLPRAAIVNPPRMGQRTPYNGDNANALYSEYSDLPSVVARDAPSDAAWNTLLPSNPTTEEQTPALAPTITAYSFAPRFFPDTPLPESFANGASQQLSGPAHIEANFPAPVASQHRLGFSEPVQAHDGMLETWNGVPTSFGYVDCSSASFLLFL